MIYSFRALKVTKIEHEYIFLFLSHNRTIIGDRKNQSTSCLFDVMRINSNKFVNQDMAASQEEINRSAEHALREVAMNIHNSALMKRYVGELTKKDR